MAQGLTHCSSSHQRRPHNPQTGCSDWSSRCRTHPGSGTRPHHRLSLEQNPPSGRQAESLCRVSKATEYLELAILGLGAKAQPE